MQVPTVYKIKSSLVIKHDAIIMQLKWHFTFMGISIFSESTIA
jgi:hypothetical protein